MLFGLAPAVRGTRVAAREMLRVGTRGADGGRQSVGIRRTLVVVQIALSLALLFASLLFAGTFRNVIHIDPGFTPDGLLVADLNLAPLKTSVESRTMLQERIIEGIRAVPGVRSAATVTNVPLGGSSGSNDVWPEASRNRSFESHINRAGAGYFATLNIPLLAGRDFDGRDTPDTSAVAIVNERFAARLGGRAAAVGQRFTREATPRAPEKTYEIVGVVGNSSYLTLTETPSPVAYYAQNQDAPQEDVQLIVRSTVPPAAATSAITAALADIDPRLEVRYAVLPTMIRDTLVQERLLAELSGGFGALAGLLTMVGLYGLIAYSVSRRTGEIGIRIALGATRASVIRLVLQEMGPVLIIGLILGTGLALAGGRVAATLLFGVKPHDPALLAGAVGLLAAIALVAGFIPARRATRIDPIVALRAE